VATLKAKTTKNPVAKKPVKVSTAKNHKIDVGSKAPNFSMPATILTTVSTISLKGKPFVLYFYPKDDTSGCTAEACGFRDQLPALKRLGIIVIGVSKDPIASHEKFAKKYNLTFPLASDPETKVCELFGTWVEKSMYGRKYMGIERSTFLIDAKGVVRHVWRKVSVPGHIEEVQEQIKQLPKS
jgi:peroxiredoxin Q/BCP